VHDRIRPGGDERGAHRREVENVPAMDMDAVPDRGEIRERRILVREAVHKGTIGDEALGEVAARESGDAGDENGAGHRRRVLVRAGECRRFARAMTMT